MMHPTAVPRTEEEQWRHSPLRTRIQPGTSALIAMTNDAVIDKAHETFAEMHPQLIHRNLSTEDQARLHELPAEN